MDKPAPVARRNEYEVLAQRPATCKSCGAEIVWATSRTGRAVPLSVATLEHRDGKAFALPHFADCPHAKDWSKR